MSVIAVFRVEIFFAHNEQENALNEAHNAGYACPAEEQIDNAPSNPAQIEFMYAKAAEKKWRRVPQQVYFYRSAQGFRDCRERAGAIVVRRISGIFQLLR